MGFNRRTLCNLFPMTGYSLSKYGFHRDIHLRFFQADDRIESGPYRHHILRLDPV